MYVTIVYKNGFHATRDEHLCFVLKEHVGPNGDDWLGGDETPLGGFPWRGGAERETTGILMWNEPFEIRQANGDKV